MSALTIEGIKEEIKTRTATYRNDPPILLSGYNQEKQTVQDYEGRQLLELMQNADDAKSDILRITLDTAIGKLSIQNNGDAFSLEGVKSLMFTGNSSKNKEEFIGNKGLGFRSILNWVHSVSIYTQTVSFRFSESHSQAYYQKHIASSEKVRQMINDEVKAKKLQVDQLPIASLAFPEIIDNLKDQDTVTNIVLDINKEEIDAIKKQIFEIREEILLFLPNIKRLIVQIDGELQIDFEKTKEEGNIISINNSQWNIYRSETKIWNDGKKDHKYKFAIAWKDDLQTNGMFYNYFPTDVATHLPCIIHATFDLTNNRKEINETNANKHILGEIVKSLGEIADERLKKSTADWQGYEFLTSISDNNRKVLKDFYMLLIATREKVKVYPTVDNQYLLKDEVVYHGEKFSAWVEDNGFGEEFQNLLLPKYGINIIVQGQYTNNVLYDNIVKLNNRLNLEQRVDLIGLLVITDSEYFIKFQQSSLQVPLLINNKGEVVSEHFKVFTKNTDGEALEFPNYINDVEFISVELYQQIKFRFNDEIRKEKYETESGDARAIKRLLDPIVNIGLDDITGVIQHIISETNKVLKTTDDKIEIVKHMVSSLFSIFRSNPDRRGNLSTINHIPLITKDNTIQFADELYFGADYSIGIDPTLIFDSIRKENEYIASNVIYSLEGDEEDIINYFKWLNVNVYSKVESIEKKLGRWESDKFIDFVFNDLENQREDVYKNYQMKSILGFERILNHELFSPEQLIAWIAKDNHFNEIIKPENAGQIYLSFGPETKSIPLKYSYLIFQIDSSNFLDKYIAGGEFDLIKGFKIIDLNNVLFKKLNIPEYKILEIIDWLGIKKSINDFSPDMIYTILKAKHSFGRENSQAFYKLIYEYFRINEDTQLKDFDVNFEEIYYVARKGGVGNDFEVKPITEVYYSDNKLLPQSMLNNFWFINLPKRTGENRVKKFFGIKLIKDIVGNIDVKVKIEHDLNKDLNSYLNRLKPYFLAYRLKSLTKIEDKKEVANNIKKAYFCLAKESFYTIDTKDFIALSNYDFIPKQDVFTIQYAKTANLESLQKDQLFCDVIAELFCILFKVGDQKNTYRSIFKDGIIETLHILKTDEQEYLLQEANQLLGVCQQEISFWKRIFLEVNFDFDTDLEMRNAIELHAKNTLPENYNKVDFSDFNNESGIEFLKWIVNNFIDIKLDHLLPNEGLISWHRRQLENEFSSLDSVVKKSLWFQANEGDIELKKKFFAYYLMYQKALNNGDFNDFLSENIFELRPNYENEIRNYCQTNLKIDTSIEVDLELKMYHDSLFSKEENIFAPVTDMKKTLKDNNIEVYSLLYFEGVEFKKIIDDKLKELALQFKESNAENSNDQIEEIEFTANFGTMQTKSPNSLKKGNRTTKLGSVTEKSKRESARKGIESENKVKKFFEQNNYDFIPISETTDAFHYDFKYKKKEETEWRYLEVKTDSGGYFYLSNAEKETGMNSEYSDRYDMAVVNGNHIQFFIKPFVSAEDSEFKAIPNDFIVYFTIHNTQEKE